MRSRGRVSATWAVLVLVLGFNGWTQATRDPAGIAIDTAWSVSQGHAEAVARAAPAVVAVRAKRKLREENGSGVLVDAGGLVLTAFHVVQEATEIRVRDHDGRDYPARIRGADEAADLALLALDAPGAVFRPIRFGDSVRARVGESVFAIGSPFGLSQTVTAGILSAKERTQVVTDNVVPLLQTDAAINPGSSGGALLNARGELIGLINAILSQTGRSQGVGFAIPVEEIHRALPFLRAGEPVRRPWIGVRVQTGRGRGVEILAVVEEGPADRAGLRPGDRILRFAGEEVSDSATLRRVLRSAAVGAEVELEAARGAETRILHLPVGARTKNQTKP